MERFDSSQFAQVPKEVLLAPDLSLAAKGVYGAICAHPAETRMNLTMLEGILPGAEGLEEAFDELVDFLERQEQKRILADAMAELTAALREQGEEE